MGKTIIAAIDVLQNRLSEGQWMLDVTGAWKEKSLGPDECVDFKTDGGTLTFSHARWLCIYDSKDRVIEETGQSILVEIIAPSGKKKQHLWTKA